MALQSVSAEGGKRRVLDTGSPFYWSWAPDGKTMIVHTGSGNSAAASRLSFLKIGTGVDEYLMEENPAAFEAPAWSPNGEFILLTNRTDKMEEIILADSTGAPIKTVDTFDLNVAMAWSFDSEHFAYISGTELVGSGTIGNLHARDVTSSKEILIEDNVIGFFWSPDGKKLAYFVPYVAKPGTDSTKSDPTTLVLQLNILDIATGESKGIFTFQPTEQFISIMPYFDQYHQSTTIWSPDSNNLLLSFIDKDGNSGVAMVAASGRLEPRLIANGVFAIWSWK
jgi:Tol biopolymer transport system component